ncbi:MAG TPA: tetratricopeptide repeat protein [Candidatus Obscuribacterales bacterium]
MSDHYERGCLLYDHRRFRQAEEEFRKGLAVSPSDAHMRSMLALAMLAQNKLSEAKQQAREAISLEPDNSFTHYAYALVLSVEGKYGDAQKAIEEAIRLNPYSAAYFAQAADIQLSQDSWKQALDFADRGLELKATDVDCLNARAIALTRLGRAREAEESIDLALAKEPESHTTHANKGWILFRQGKADEAADHYREALRLNPNSRWAREGILEALKARNPLYYPCAFITLWVSDLDRRASLFFIVLLVCIPPLRAMMFVLFLFSYLARNLFNLLLMTDPFGKRVLNEHEKGTATVCGAWLAAVISDLLLFQFFVGQTETFSLSLVFLGLVALPLLRIFDVIKGRRRIVMIAWSLLASSMGLYVVAAATMRHLTLETLDENLKGLMGMFALLCIASIFVPTGMNEDGN